MRRVAILIVALALSISGSAVAASVTGKATKAVKSEVKATFYTSTRVTVSCNRSTATRLTCRWNDRNGPGGATDYFGSARVRVGKYGGEATLYGVRCHYCRSGRIPSKML